MTTTKAKEWFMSEVFTNIKDADEFIKMNNIDLTDMKIIVLWDENK